jgi:peptidyl-prolyl cis-trans isomerase B (cyclophilin B)
MTEALPSRAVIETLHGEIEIEFFADKAPGHVKNFADLARKGFYDGTTFHRVIPGFMIQGGDPTGTGTGGPGYTIPAEFNSTSHEPGVLSMARTNDPNSAGSQFFICIGPQSFLNGQYTAFGKTADAESLAIVHKIGKVKKDRNDKPVDKVTIDKATVTEKAK